MITFELLSDSLSQSQYQIVNFWHFKSCKYKKVILKGCSFREFNRRHTLTFFGLSARPTYTRENYLYVSPPLEVVRGAVTSLLNLIPFLRRKHWGHNFQVF